MPALSTTKLWADVASSTIEKWMPQYYDQVINDVPLLKWLHFQGRKRTELGGNQILVPLMWQTNSTVKSYSGYDKIDVSPTQQFTNALYDWKQAAGSIVISGREMFQNSGDAAMINLLKSRIEATRLSLVNEINRQLHLDGAGNTTKDFDGLRLHVPVDPQATALLGGFNAAAETWWRNVSCDFGTGENANDVDLGGIKGQAQTGLLPAMFQTFNRCAWGMSTPDVLIGDMISYGHYQNINAANNRFMMADRKLVDAGFKFLDFNGAPFMYDRQISPLIATNTTTTGGIYFLNSNFLQFVVGSGRDFYATPFEKPIDQDAVVSQIILYGNLVTSARRMHGILHSIPRTY